MAAATIPLRFARPIAEFVEDLLGLRYLRSGPHADNLDLDLGEFSPRASFPVRSVPKLSREAENLEALFPASHSWQRSKVPILSDERFLPRSVLVEVPAGLRFHYRQPFSELPEELPRFSIRPLTVAQRQYLSQYGVNARLQAEHAIPPLVARRKGRLAVMERNRKRHDHKWFGHNAYVKALVLVNRTYGNVSEFEDFMQAWEANPWNMHAVMTQLAVNQAVDASYGERSRLLKEHLYAQPWYRLPVGIDFLRRML